MKQLASALEYLKNMNIVHRDLKPQNILLSSDYRTLKITDFNFARELYENDLAQTLCGSPLYMAPEIIEKQHYSIKSDLWSVGMILYEMVYGNNPYFDACNVIDLLQKIKERSIQYSDRVSPECNNLLSSLLERDPEKRITWKDFFIHNWLQSDIQKDKWPSDIVFSTELKQNTKPSSIYSSHNTVPHSKPVAITTRKEKYTYSDSLYDSQGNSKFKVDVLENYVPIGITPPKHTRSEPVSILHVKPPKSRGNSIVKLPNHVNFVQQSRRVSSSAPESKNVADSIWSYMSSSAAVLKGAVDYISSTNPKK